MALYDTCGLLQVHDVYNTILLRSTCREHFNQDWLGIQEIGTTYTIRWVVKADLRSTLLPHSSDNTYGTLHGTNVKFPFVVPARMATLTPEPTPTSTRPRRRCCRGAK